MKREKANAILVKFGRQRLFNCEQCGKVVGFKRSPGRNPKFCSNACKQKKYRKIRNSLIFNHFSAKSSECYEIRPDSTRAGAGAGND